LFEKTPVVSSAPVTAEHLAELRAKNIVKPSTQRLDTITTIADKISQAAITEGWATSPSSDIMKLVNTTMKELPLQKNLKNLSDFITQVGATANKDPMNGSLRRAGGMITKILKEAEADVIAAKLGEKEGPLAVEAFKMARTQYAAQAALKDAIDSRLHAGGSTSGFAKSLRAMAQTDGETLLRRLSGSNDADLLKFMQQNYPETAKLVRDYHINDLLKTASDKAKGDMTINSEALLSKFNKMSPELKQLMVTPEGAGKLTAVETLLSEFNNLPHNHSNTARTVDKLMQYIPGSAIGLATMLHDHNPITAALAGTFAKILGKDVPDAVRLSMLKFLGSNKQISSEGFKQMVDLISHTVKAENMIGKSVKNVFKAGSEVLPQYAVPKARDREALMKAVDALNQDPEKMLNLSGKAGHYMPDHATAIGGVAGKAVQLLSAVRPNTNPQNPLDSKRIPSDVEKARYNRALDVAQQPLIVLKHIAEGRLTPEDVDLQKGLYPALYKSLSSKLLDQAVSVQAKGGVIPYHVKQSMSLYMGTPLDATMTPQGIQAAQPKPQQNQLETPMQPASGPKHSTNALNKMPGLYRTSGQEAEMNRRNRQK
jgi:hypothetical protein